MFILFAGDTYYPAGGWGDFVGKFDTLDAAKEAGKQLRRVHWWHIVDLNTLEEVWSN